MSKSATKRAATLPKLPAKPKRIGTKAPARRAAPAGKPKTPDMLKRLAQANREAASRYNKDQAQRLEAPNILNPQEVAGDYDSARLLHTTLGGKLRKLTHDDLRAFERNAKALGKSFKGGVTAKGIIDRSLPDDRARSTAEIQTAVPVRSMKGFVHFLTNASQGSKDSRHNVLIEFPTYAGILAAPIKSADAAASMASGPIKIDCDCGRHRFWFRYIATLGNYNAGRAETGFPKIRNPNLSGLACKHVLRVAKVLSTPSVRKYLEQMIDRGRQQIDHKATKTLLKDAKAMVEQQAKQAHYKRNLVESTQEKQTRIAQQRAVKGLATKSRTRVQAIKSDPVALARELATLQRTMQKLQAMNALDADTVRALMSKFTPK